MAGTLPPDLAAGLARAAESAGYGRFWVNDTPAGEALVLLQAAAEQTATIGLAVGLLPLDRWTPGQIERRMVELDLPVDRLTIGVGSGGGPGGLQRVRDGVAALRQCTSTRIVVGALGPRMLRLAGELADGVLLDWVTPAAAREAADHVRAIARAAGRPPPSVATYAFTAVAGPAADRLQAEIDYYGAVPAYVAHFERNGIHPREAVGVAGGPDHGAVLSGFDAVLDETVVRAVTHEQSAKAYLDVLIAARPDEPA